MANEKKPVHKYKWQKESIMSFSNYFKSMTFSQFRRPLRIFFFITWQVILFTILFNPLANLILIDIQFCGYGTG